MNKNIKLYHYSNANIKDKIKVAYYGNNYFTVNDTKVTNIKRSFFYIKPKPEYLLSASKYRYSLNFNLSKLYNLTKDCKPYLRNKSITQALSIIKRKYKGVIYKIGNRYIVNLFIDVKYIQKEIL